MFRTAAGLVKVLGGISDIPLLDAGRYGYGTDGTRRYCRRRKSHRTTAQLEELLKLDNVVPVAFDSNKVLDGDEAWQ